MSPLKEGPPLNLCRLVARRLRAWTVVHRDGSTTLVSNPTDFPEPSEFASGGRVKAVLEPIVIIPPRKPRAQRCVLKHELAQEQGQDMHAHEGVCENEGGDAERDEYRARGED